MDTDAEVIDHCTAYHCRQVTLLLYLTSCVFEGVEGRVRSRQV